MPELPQKDILQKGNNRKLFTMTKIELLWFKCIRCSRSFMSYVEGKPIYDNCQDGICFDSDDIGTIHNNSYLKTIQNKRECRKCRKHVDLMTYK